jgi:trimeric autotransporter adhesin
MNSTAIGGAIASKDAKDGVAIGYNATVSAPNSVALGAGTVADRPNVVAVGGRTITGVANGVYANDAVNKGQLDSVQRESRRGISASTALAMIPGLQEDRSVSIGVGFGGYKGEKAMAVGVSAKLHERIFIKAGAGIAGGGDTNYGAGASFQW